VVITFEGGQEVVAIPALVNEEASKDEDNTGNHT
jgi:hypothetical protein